MRPPRARPAVRLILAVGATTALGCGELPTQLDDAPVREAAFALGDESAKGFMDALNDVRDRILPTLARTDEANASWLSELTGAITSRDRAALRRALARADSALASFGRTDAAIESIGADLDALRLILDEARPLANGETHTSTR